MAFHYFIYCWDGTDFSLQSLFPYFNLGSRGFAVPVQVHHSFPRLFFYVYIESPIPVKPREPDATSPKPHQLKTPTQEPNPRPKAPNPNQPLMSRIEKKSLKNNPGRKI